MRSWSETGAVLSLLILSGCVTPIVAPDESQSSAYWGSWLLEIRDDARLQTFRLDLVPRGWADVPGPSGTVLLESVEFSTLRGTDLDDSVVIPYFLGRSGVVSHLDTTANVFRMHPVGLYGISWYPERGALVAMHVTAGLASTGAFHEDQGAALPYIGCEWQQVIAMNRTHVCLQGGRVVAVHDQGPKWASFSKVVQEAGTFDLELSGDPGHSRDLARFPWMRSASGAIEVTVPPMGDALRAQEDLDALLGSASARPMHAQYTAMRPPEAADLLWHAWWTGLEGEGGLVGVAYGIRNAAAGLSGLAWEVSVQRHVYVGKSEALVAWESEDGDALPQAVVSLAEAQKAHGSSFDIVAAMWYAAFEDGRPLLTWMISEACVDGGDGRYRMIDAVTGDLLIDGKINTADGRCGYYFPTVGDSISLPRNGLSTAPALTPTP